VRRSAGRALAALSCAVLAGCPLPGSGPGCRPLQGGAALPEGLEESSGVAVSRAHAGVYWTHADKGAPYLWAVDASGARVGRVRLSGTTVVDWEDIELAACGDADCLYVADTGDNAEQRRTVHVHRLREPDPGTDTVAAFETFEMRLPDGARDIEALFVLPGERLHLVTKGRNHAVSIYRYPGALGADSVVVLEEVQRLGEEARALPRQVTGASADATGERVAIRTYEVLNLFRVVGDTLAPIEDGTLNLRTLREGQGEGVGLGEDGLIALTSEAGPLGQHGSIALVRCEW
jgi:hypothetical protein